MMGLKKVGQRAYCSEPRMGEQLAALLAEQWESLMVAQLDMQSVGMTGN